MGGRGFQRDLSSRKLAIMLAGVLRGNGQMDGHFLDAFLGAIFGGIVTIGITVWAERLRSPTVRLTLGTSETFRPRGPFAHNWRSLRVAVTNARLPLWADWWMARLPAQQCRAQISFLRLNGTPFLQQPMVARWAGGSPEPRVAHVPTADGGTEPFLTNYQELKNTVDIYPGDTEQLDVAIRVDQEIDAYAWNNDTYFFPNWRNPNRQLNHECYLIRVYRHLLRPKMHRLLSRR
jgi:hypothetical protein